MFCKNLRSAVSVVSTARIWPGLDSTNDFQINSGARGESGGCGASQDADHNQMSSDGLVHRLGETDSGLAQQVPCLANASDSGNKSSSSVYLIANRSGSEATFKESRLRVPLRPGEAWVIPHNEWKDLLYRGLPPPTASTWFPFKHKVWAVEAPAAHQFGSWFWSDSQLGAFPSVGWK
ncbi:hypothetical protein EYF80_034527 [Liparis tanakae]|uniref:Uncharacterized protein n=1 Tax=Liparis tanakae TaxID=230148 RepID=A0A4Z2GPP8_9TELE|nr:hypothetical protein EYF80_034527 [Liparis tanakae]